MRRSLLSFAVALAVLTTTVRADNWAHWRGPTGNSVSPTAHPPTEWSATKNVKWKVLIPGRGTGSPVIWEDQVFVVSAVRSDGQTEPQGAAPPSGPNAGGRGGPGGGRPGGGRPGGGRPGGGRGFGGGRPGGEGGGETLPKLQFKIYCFDRQSGALRWEQTAIEATPHQQVHQTNSFASASPCTDGQHVYAHFGSRGLYCYTMTGDLVWKRDDFGKMETRSGFGEGSSPTIAGDKILVPWDHEGESFLYGLDKATGKTIWKTPRDEPTCWATPLVVDVDGKPQVVMNGQTCARAYDLASGQELWRCGGQTARPCSSAVAGGGLVFVGSGFQGNFLGAFRLTGSGDIEDTDAVAWTTERDCPDVASPMLSGGRLYYHKGKGGQLTCVDSATGKPFYSAARIDDIRSTYASPVAAGGHVYLTGRSGTTVVIKDAESLEIVATNSVGEGVDATPAPVDNELFIRGEQHLFCITE
ncbi:outer membrane protein assembly factor BamB family protein [Novipirellula artificiosorum]|uniref:Outer membrane protein assembly factor BamB n=1 Tax=Novipirellula artificiosorum TaxID=2528016 RepID=A0A5C6D385_9BACT|nr:PQQ-binding-like beta-propeller repeat protein [Novipirellula artificiosorum]TWU31208.1 Outer membrane protein assembly factor BamB [Novipirellula artificiosorum]